MASAVALVVVVVGIPVLLVVCSRAGLGSSQPIPGIGSSDEIGDYFERGLSTTEVTPLALRTLLCVAWLLWLGLVVSVIGSLAEGLAGSRFGLPRFGAFGSLGTWIAAGFTGVAALTPLAGFAGASSPAPFTLNRAFTTVDAAGFGSASVAEAAAVPHGFVRVLAGESAETVAGRALGDSDRWEELWQLNRDQAVGPAGERWVEAWNLLPGSLLALPADASAELAVADSAADGSSVTPLTSATGDPRATMASSTSSPVPAHAAVASLEVATVDDDGSGDRLAGNFGDQWPAVVVVAADEGPAGPGATDGATAVGTEHEYVVVAGDSYWSIANARAIADHGADGATNAVVYELMLDLRDLNAARLDHSHRDVIVPGDVVWLFDPANPPVAPPADQSPPSVEPVVDTAPVVIAEPEPSAVMIETALDAVGGVADGGTVVGSADAVTPAIAPDDTPPPSPAPVPPSTVAAAPVPPSTAATATTLDEGAVSEIGADHRRAPLGVGEAALLATGLLGLLAARRRRILRAAEPPARIPVPAAADVEVERQLRAVDDPERAARVDVAIRAAAATLIEGSAQLAYVLSRRNGEITVRLTLPTALPSPWEGGGNEWTLAATVPIEQLAPTARTVGAPCIALTQIGITPDGADVIVDLEGLGTLTVGGDPAPAQAIVRAVAAGVASCELADIAHLIGVGVHEHALLDHPHGQVVPTVSEAMTLATTLAGSTIDSFRSTFALRARHTSGERWEPVVVVVADVPVGAATGELMATSKLPGVAVVAAGEIPGARWRLVPRDQGAGLGDPWMLEPAGLTVLPVGLDLPTTGALVALVAPELEPVTVETDAQPVLARRYAVPPLDVLELVDEGGDGTAERPVPTWKAMVRLVGTPDIVGPDGSAVAFERSKPLELLAWMATHRHVSTRSNARTALWLADVRDSTFANVVSEARRSLARELELATGEDWIARTMNEKLVLHDDVLVDVDEMRAAVAAASVAADHATALGVLRPAVELVRGMPFAGTDYLWSDAEGLTSELVLLATSVTAAFAEHALAADDIDGVFWATGKGLAVLSGQESLVALRMRAHAARGDRSGVQLEWESYERVVIADSWSDGELSPKLVELRRSLLGG